MSEKVAIFPEPLASFAQIDSDGFASFNYAREAGMLSAVLDRVIETLEAAEAMPAKTRKAELRELLAELRQKQTTLRQAGEQWSAHLAARRADRERRRTTKSESRS